MIYMKSTHSWKVETQTAGHWIKKVSSKSTDSNTWPPHTPLRAVQKGGSGGIEKAWMAGVHLIGYLRRLKSGRITISGKMLDILKAAGIS
jgi:hypothetical protein